jgi:hypothetical protein
MDSSGALCDLDTDISQELAKLGQDYKEGKLLTGEVIVSFLLSYVILLTSYIAQSDLHQTPPGIRSSFPRTEK